MNFELSQKNPKMHPLRKRSLPNFANITELFYDSGVQGLFARSHFAAPPNNFEELLVNTLPYSC